mmetsp:Transcript_22333/g.55125  ORF Transcript_22333/g.55125 Transcript_22333/m.55125 type:complete len:570 (+) Transcript_22333:914-2623(+)
MRFRSAWTATPACASVFSAHKVRMKPTNASSLSCVAASIASAPSPSAASRSIMRNSAPSMTPLPSESHNLNSSRRSVISSSGRMASEIIMLASVPLAPTPCCMRCCSTSSALVAAHVTPSLRSLHAHRITARNESALTRSLAPFRPKRSAAASQSAPTSANKRFTSSSRTYPFFSTSHAPKSAFNLMLSSLIIAEFVIATPASIKPVRVWFWSLAMSTPRDVTTSSPTAPPNSCRMNRWNSTGPTWPESSTSNASNTTCEKSTMSAPSALSRGLSSATSTVSVWFSSINANNAATCCVKGYSRAKVVTACSSASSNDSRVSIESFAQSCRKSAVSSALSRRSEPMIARRLGHISNALIAPPTSSISSKPLPETSHASKQPARRMYSASLRESVAGTEHVNASASSLQSWPAGLRMTASCAFVLANSSNVTPRIPSRWSCRRSYGISKRVRMCPTASGGCTITVSSSAMSTCARMLKLCRNASGDISWRSVSPPGSARRTLRRTLRWGRRCKEASRNTFQFLGRCSASSLTTNSKMKGNLCAEVYLNVSAAVTARPRGRSGCWAEITILL